MFGFSKKEKQDKLINQAQRELSDILLRHNVRDNLQSFGRGSTANETIHGTPDTLHNVFQDFGYPVNLSFWDYFNMYDRFGPALAVVEIPVNLSWLQVPIIKGKGNFDSEFEKLVDKVHFWKRMKGWDNYQRVGRYAGMFQQIRDDRATSEPVDIALSGSSVEKLLNLIPIYEGHLKVHEINEDITSEDFGKPIMYQYCPIGFDQVGDGLGNSYDIHPSRIQISAEGAFDGTLNGRPVLKSIFNDLQDLQKISGAGGEGFYQNARNAPIINIPDKNKAPTGDAKTELQDALDDYVSKFQKKFIAQGMEFVNHSITMDSPKEFADNSRGNIAAGSGTATAIIFGQQMGVRAADKDFELLLTVVQGRRESHCDEMVKNEIDALINIGVLPNEEYEVEWEDITELSDGDKIALAEQMMGVNEKAMRGQIEPVFGADEAREIAGFDNKTIERVEGDFWEWDNRISITQQDILDILDANLQTTQNELPFDWYFSQYDELAYRSGTFQANAEVSAFVSQPIDDIELLFKQAYQEGLAVIQANDYRLLQNLSRTTSIEVFGVIQNGMDAGLNRTEIRNDIIRRFEVSQSSSERIVRTEINKAYNVARTDLNDIYNDVGINLAVVHISALLAGGRTRPSHARRHGKVFSTIEQNKWWNKKPNRINCFCSTRAVELDDDDNVINQSRYDKISDQGKEFFKLDKGE